MASPPKFRASRYLHLSLGLATFRVGIAPFKTDPKGGSSHYICEEHRVKVKQRWYCEEGDHYIERQNADGETTYQPIKGYPYGDQYVILDEATLDEIAVPKQDNLVFDRWDDHLDPVWVEKTYLVQGDDEAAVRTFDAFAASLAKNGIVLFGTVCLGTTTHMMALKWSDDLGTLVLHQLHLAARLKLQEAENSRAGILNRDQPAARVVAEVKRTVGAVAEKGASFDTPDIAREALLAAIEEVATGGMLKDTKKKPEKEPAQVVDLMAALRASVDQAQQDKKKRKPPARKTAKGGSK
jgi:DNA end-binding protein Ku